MANSGKIATILNNVLTNSDVDLSTKADLVAGSLPTSQLPSDLQGLAALGTGIIKKQSDGSYAIDSSTYATQTYVSTAIANLVASAPAALDTLNELAAALGNDASFSTTISTSLGNRLRVDTASQGLTGTQQSNARTNLGLGSLAILSSIGNSYITDLAWSKLTSVPTTIAGYGITDSLVYTTSTYSNPSWITTLAWSKITGAPAFITSYTEVDTLATVTGRGASTSTASSFTGGATITGLTIAKSGTDSLITFPAQTNDPGYIKHYESNNTAIMYFNVSDDSNDFFHFGYTGNTDAFKLRSDGVITVGTWQGSAIADSYISSAATWNAKQAALSGTGFVKISGTTISYDNSTYLTGITSSQVTTALGYTPYNATNPNGYITGITSSNVTTALGYTPYNSTNPSGYITSSATITGGAAYLTTTNQGRTGAQGLIDVTSTTDWSNFPIGYSGMFRSGQAGLGAPSSTYGFFIKVANRDAGGGWGGIWMDYSNGDMYQGTTTVSTSYATWRKLWDSSNLTNLNQLTNGPGYITGITSSMVTTALGYTPYNAGSNTVITSANYTSYAAPAGKGLGDSPIVGGGYAISNYTLTGFYYFAGATGIPTTYFQAGILGSSNGDYAQYGIGSNQEMYFRWSTGTWKKVWTDANLTNLNQLSNGPGYITSSSLSSYLPLSGGTMSGVINMAGTQVILGSGFAGIEYHNTSGQWEGYVGTESGSGHLRYNSRQGNHTWYSNSSQAMKLNSGGTLDVYRIRVGGSTHDYEATEGVIRFSNSYNQHNYIVSNASGWNSWNQWIRYIAGTNTWRIGTYDEANNSGYSMWRLAGLNRSSNSELNYIVAGPRGAWGSNDRVVLWNPYARYDGGSYNGDGTHYKILDASNYTSYAVRFNSTSSYGSGLNNSGTIENSITIFDGYGAPVPNYPNNQWWVGAVCIGNSSRGIQLAGGYSDSELYFRKGQDGWTSWRRLINDTNYTSYYSYNLLQCNTIRIGNYAERSFDLGYFTNGVNNWVSYIDFGNVQTSGYLEVEVTSTYSYQNSTGLLRKILPFGTNANASIWYNGDSKVQESNGSIADNIFIGDLEWSGSNFRLPIYHTTNTGNGFVARVKFFNSPGNAYEVLSAATVSSSTRSLPTNYSNNPAFNRSLDARTVRMYNTDSIGWRYSSTDSNMYNYIYSSYDDTSTGITYRSGQWTSGQSITCHKFQTYSSGWQDRLIIYQNGSTELNRDLKIGTGINGSQYNVLSENQLYRTGGGDLFINNSGSGHVRVAEGGGSLLVNTGTRWNNEKFGIQISNSASWSSVPAMMRLTNNGSGYRTKITFTDSNIIDGWFGMVPTSGYSYFVMGFSGYTEEGFKVYQNGNVVAAGDVTAYSDMRVKENITTIDKALDKTLALRGVYYNRTDTADKRKKIGVIAQEVEKIAPELVTRMEDDMLNVSYGNMAGLFIEAIKEQQSQIESQKTEIEELKELVKQLINR